MLAGEQSHDVPVAPVALRRRGPFSRLSAAHLLMVVAAVLAFSVNLLVLRSRDDTVAVVAVAAPVAAGEIVTAADFKVAQVDVAPDILAALHRWDEVDNISGRVTTRALIPGELVGPSSFVDPAATQGRRSMSVPIEPAHAVGGLLAPGDRIDLILVTEAGPSYVLTGAEVLAVADSDRSGLGSVGGFHVVIAVEADEALAVAAAINQGDLELVRSTGAPPSP